MQWRPKSTTLRRTYFSSASANPNSSRSAGFLRATTATDMNPRACTEHGARSERGHCDVARSVALTSPGFSSRRRSKDQRRTRSRRLPTKKVGMEHRAPQKSTETTSVFKGTLRGSRHQPCRSSMPAFANKQTSKQTHTNVRFNLLTNSVAARRAAALRACGFNGTNGRHPNLVEVPWELGLHFEQLNVRFHAALAPLQEHLAAPTQSNATQRQATPFVAPTRTTTTATTTDDAYLLLRRRCNRLAAAHAALNRASLRTWREVKS